MEPPEPINEVPITAHDVSDSDRPERTTCKAKPAAVDDDEHERLIKLSQIY